MERAEIIDKEFRPTKNFAQLFSLISMVDLQPSSFKWIPGTTPMSDLRHLAIAEVIYFVVIFGLQACLRKPSSENPETKSKDSWFFKFSLCLHNAILCVLSLAMFVGAGYEAWLRSR